MAAATPLKVSIVNDYDIIVEGLRSMLAPYADRVVVVETEVGGVPDEPVDVVLFDTFASRRNSIQRVNAIDADPSLPRLVLYTWDAPPAFLDDIDRDRIEAVLPKRLSGENLVQAIEQVVAGKPVTADLLVEERGNATLTEREREVLALIARGMSNPEIATELYLSVDTVKTHVRTLFRKLNVSNRTQAALAAREHRLDSSLAN